VYCFDTDVLSAVIWPRPTLPVVRRLAGLSPDEQCTTAITLGELLYGLARRGGERLSERMREALRDRAQIVFPFDERAAEVYGALRAGLERRGTRLDDPDLRIASIALARDLTLVTGNVKHFARVPDLHVENWLEP